IIAGIIVNRVMYVSTLFGQNINILSPWTLVVILVVVIILLIFGVVKVVPRDVSADAIRNLKIIKMYESLLRVLACWGKPSTQDQHNEQYKNVVKDILIETVNLFGDDGRAAVLLPDPADPDSIMCYEDVKMASSSVAAMRFYVGDDPQRQERE